MREGGYSTSERLELDVAFVTFANRFRLERDATRSKWEKPEKPPHKGQVRVQVPKHERDDLLRMLGIDPVEVDRSDALAALAEAAGLDAETWSALPDYPEEEAE